MKNRSHRSFTVVTNLYHLRHSTVRNLWAVPLNVVPNAAPGGEGLYKTPVVTALGGGIGLAVNVTGGKYNVNVQYILKPGRPAHWEAELLAIAHVTQQQFSTAQLMGHMNKYDTCPL